MIQLLSRENASRYVVKRSIKLLPEDSSEIDAEALALDGNTLYVLGSHARARKRISETAAQSENRERLATIQRETTREKLFRFDIDPKTGKRSSDITVASRNPLTTDPDEIDQIMAFGVMMTPALAVDGEVKVSGKVPGIDKIKGYIK